MTETFAVTLTAAQLKTHLQTLEVLASRILAALADGNYDPEIVVTEAFLRNLGIVLPPAAAVIDEAAKAILMLSRFTALPGHPRRLCSNHK